MTLNVPNNIDSVVLMLNDLGSDKVEKDASSFVVHPNESRGISWTIKESIESLKSHAESLEDTAVVLGLGGRYSPGVALMTIHLQEKIATAPTECSRIIKISDGRFQVF